MLLNGTNVKSFGLYAYRDSNFHQLVDSTSRINDEKKADEWVWECASEGFYVEKFDRSSRETTRYRPTRSNDKSVKDLIV